MADSYSLIDGQVIPYYGGRRSTSTDEWRDATSLELEQASEIESLEAKILLLESEIEELREQLDGSND